MNKRNIILIFSAVIIVLCIIFTILGSEMVLGAVWGGFSYFTLSCLVLLALSWAGYLILYYLTDFKKEIEDGFMMYRANIVNQKNITSADFDKKIEAYRKEYNKTLWKDKLVNIFKIVFCFAVAVMFIIAMFFM